MKIIISPAKKMNIDSDTFAAEGTPVFIKDAKLLRNAVRALTFQEAKVLWKCNDQLARLNYERFQHMVPERGLTPAIMSYEGLQYQYMAPGVFTTEGISYIEKHLRILSGFYGVLRPFDGVTPYRLEMQAKLSVNGCKDLYDFWGDRLYKSVIDEDRTIINLASREYARCIEKYMQPGDRFLTVDFGELAGKRVKQKGTLAKMARGRMVRFLAENGIENPEQMKEFREMGFSFREELSGKEKYVFVREESSRQ